MDEIMDEKIMDEKERNNIKEECKRKCTCDDCEGSGRPRSRNEFGNEEQRTFISFVTETISVMAFIFFGSVVFWLAVGGILFDFLKRLYYSDRYVKLFITGLFTLMLLSMTIRGYVHRRACRANLTKHQLEISKKNAKVIPPPPPPPPPEYLKISFKDKNLQKKSEKKDTKKDGKKDDQKMIEKKFTMTITNEKKKEVFKTSKIFFIPEMAMEMKKPPILIVFLKDLVLENY